MSVAGRDVFESPPPIDSYKAVAHTSADTAARYWRNWDGFVTAFDLDDTIVMQRSLAALEIFVMNFTQVAPKFENAVRPRHLATAGKSVAVESTDQQKEQRFRLRFRTADINGLLAAFSAGAVLALLTWVVMRG